jgi:RNA-directed DNA polymerase
MTDQPTEAKPASVRTAKQAGEDGGHLWLLAEPVVWTTRMLTALETGVKGGKWFSLIDKVASPRVLDWAFTQVAAKEGAAGVDHQTITMYGARQAEETERLVRQLREGSYRPAAIKRVWIPKPGSKEKRPLGIPVVRDRVVQKGLQAALEPIFEREFAEQSYGFRPGRSCRDALRRVEQLLKAGYAWVVDADLQSYFDTIPHEQLLARVAEKISDGQVLKLLQQYLEQGVLDGLREWQPETGTPQGAVISPLLANIYLNPLDHLIAGAGIEMVRYADDIVLLCRSEAEAKRGLQLLQEWTASAGLRLHPEKTRIVDATQETGFEFLGYHFRRGQKWPRRKSLKKIKDTVRAKTKRHNGHSLSTIIDDVNQSTRGWFEYFKYSHRYTFDRLDQFIRTRLRSVLRRRSGKRGRATRAENVKWPNAYLRVQGLLFLADTHAQLRQSQRG